MTADLTVVTKIGAVEYWYMLAGIVMLNTSF